MDPFSKINGFEKTGCIGLLFSHQVMEKMLKIQGKRNHTRSVKKPEIRN